MKKTTILIVSIIILIGIGIFVSWNSFLFTGKIIENKHLRSSTIALCDEANYCEDYEIECEGNTTTKITTTGFAIQHDKNWEDPRGKQKDNLCE